MRKYTYKRKKNFRSWIEIGVSAEERRRIYHGFLQQAKHLIYKKYKKQTLKILRKLMDDEYQRRKNGK